MAFGIADIWNHESGFEEYIDFTVSQLYYYADSNVFRSEVLETHPCSDAELGLDITKASKFYSMNEQVI